MDDDAPLSTLRNLGPAMERAFAAVDIVTVGQLRDLGADAAYGRLLAAGTRPHFIGYYVLEMALQGRPWNDCKGEEKKALRGRFDALKVRNVDTDRVAFEAMMNAIGVIER
ncbi:TfoX/Sxy family protein [Jannaschia donghaensis]|uniref:Regulator of competence-specific genes n=1 Tax=Jannaschia donghaensis TaxID=420998 RepID=A0A0M6YPD4_9RHOB|nr:TfoX/Sxy family protein [Jannaschia donghaensis]CTQ51107.1 Regulator of competence-specific genes [Jannaschia donghaensis]